MEWISVWRHLINSDGTRTEQIFTPRLDFGQLLLLLIVLIDNVNSSKLLHLALFQILNVNFYSKNT